MGLLEFFLPGSGVAQWAGDNKNYLRGIGAGLANGKSFESGLSKAALWGTQGAQVDDAFATQKKEEQKRQEQLSYTVKAMRDAGFEDLAQYAEAGFVGEAFNEFIKRKSPKGQPELMKVGPGDSVFDPAIRQPVYTAPGDENWRTITDPAERQSFGIPQDDTSVWQINQSGQLRSEGSKGQTINVGQGENEYDKKMGAHLADRYTTVQSEAASAGNTLATLSAMEAATKSPEFYSGFGAQPVLAVRQAVAALGLAPEAASSMEAFNALASQAALSNMGGSLGAGFSNADRDFVLSMVPNLGASEEGNAKLIDIHRKLAERKVQIGQLADQYAATHGGRIDGGFQTFLSQWAEENPLFEEEAAAGDTGGGVTAINPATGQRIRLGPNGWEPM